MNNENLNEFKQLLQKLSDETITVEERLRLEDVLLESETARVEYLIATNFDASMQAYADADDVEQFVIPPEILPTETQGFSRPFLGLVFSAIVIPVAIALICFQSMKQQSAFTPPANLLTLTVLSTKSALSGTNEDFETRQQLLGRISIASGVLTVGTSGGSLVSLEGPCEFEMVGDQVAKLHSGKMVAFCGKETKKLTVNTPSGDYVDIGTEFGVMVSNDSTRLHVFDGEVGATNSHAPNTEMLTVEAASSLQSEPDGSLHRSGMVDFAGFGELREALSDSVLSERFSSPLFEESDRHSREHWKVGHSFTDQRKVRVRTENPLMEGMGGYLQLEAQTLGENAEHLPLLSTYWDYEQPGTVDLGLPHSIECVIRLDSDPRDVENLEMFGGNSPTWKNRSWEVRTFQIDGKSMWSVYASEIGSKKRRQVLELRHGVPYFLQVEIDPQIGRYRITVSDGENRIRTQLYDGSPLRLKKEAGPLGLIHWQLRSKPGKKISYSIDEVQVRNRPVFGEQEKLSDTVNGPVTKRAQQSVSSKSENDSEVTAVGRLYSDNVNKQKWSPLPAAKPPAAILDSVPLPKLTQDQTWEPTFVDQFDGKKIDEAKWNILGDRRRKYGYWRKSNATLDGNGNLVLRVSKGAVTESDEEDENVVQDAFFGGGLDSNDKFEQAFGYFECRCKMLKDDGSGYHCSFWLQSDTMGDVSDGGRNGTEIDIIEKFHNKEVIQHCLHWDGYKKQHKRTKFEFPWPGIRDGFHIFALKWTPEEYTFYVDGVKTWTTRAGGVSQVPTFLRLTTEFSQGWNGDIHEADLPDEFIVDYVKVYKAVPKQK